MITDSAMRRYNGNARQDELPGARSVGRVTHPANAVGATDAKTSAVPVGEHSRLGLLFQPVPRDLTGGPAVQAAGFPAS